jgi:hypothetical protein
LATPHLQDRTPRPRIVLAMPLAVALYRASGLVLWRFSDAGPRARRSVNHWAGIRKPSQNLTLCFGRYGSIVRPGGPRWETLHSSQQSNRLLVMKQAAALKNYQGSALLPSIKISIGPWNFRPIKHPRLAQFDGRTWRRSRNGVCQHRQIGVSGSTIFRMEDAQIMAETRKLSVEKALNKIRADDAQKSRSTRRDEKMDALDEEIKRMRAQRLRLERDQRKRD